MLRPRGVILQEVLLTVLEIPRARAESLGYSLFATPAVRGARGGSSARGVASLLLRRLVASSAVGLAIDLSILPGRRVAAPNRVRAISATAVA